MLQFLDSLDAYSGTPPKPSPAPATSSLPRSTSANTLSGGVKPPPSTSTASTNSPAKPPGAAAPSNAAEAQSVLDFLDEITQRSSTPTARASLGGAASEAGVAGGGGGGGRALEKKTSIPSGLSRSTSRTNLGAVPLRKSTDGGAGAAAPPRRSTDSARSVRTAGSSPRPTPAGVSTPPVPPQAATPAAPSAASALDAATDTGAGGWGWSSMWNQASSVVQQASVLAAQAKTAAEEQVKAAQESAAANGGLGGGIAGIGGGLIKALGENGGEQAKKWGETVSSYAKGAHLDQLGTSFPYPSPLPSPVADVLKCLFRLTDVQARSSSRRRSNRSPTSSTPLRRPSPSTRSFRSRSRTIWSATMASRRLCTAGWQRCARFFPFFLLSSLPLFTLSTSEAY